MSAGSSLQAELKNASPVIAAARERVHVVAQSPRVLLDQLAARVVVCFVERGLHRIERRLRVDEDATLPGKVHGHVGTRASLFERDRLLLGEVAVRRHAGLLDDVAQLHLAPFPARGRVAQGRDERRGLRREIRRCVLEFLGAAAQLGEEPVELPEFLRDRRDELADALAGAQSGRFAQLVLRALDQRVDLRLAGVLRVRERRAQRGLLRARRQPGDDRADRRAEEKDAECLECHYCVVPPRYFLKNASVRAHASADADASYDARVSSKNACPAPS